MKINQLINQLINQSIKNNIYRLVGWLAGWLAGWLTDWLHDWLVNWFAVIPDCKLIFYFNYFRLNYFAFCMLGYLSEEIDNSNWNTFLKCNFLIFNWNTLRKYFIRRKLLVKSMAEGCRDKIIWIIHDNVSYSLSSPNCSFKQLCRYFNGYGPLTLECQRTPSWFSHTFSQR